MRPPNYPVIVVHLDDGHGNVACTGDPMPARPAEQHDRVPRYSCPGCAAGGRPSNPAGESSDPPPDPYEVYLEAHRDRVALCLDVALGATLVAAAVLDGRACTGDPMPARPAEQHDRVPRYSCPGCAAGGRPSNPAGESLFIIRGGF